MQVYAWMEFPLLISGIWLLKEFHSPSKHFTKPKERECRETCYTNIQQVQGVSLVRAYSNAWLGHLEYRTSRKKNTFFGRLGLFRFSRVWRPSFAIGVSDLYFFSPSSSIFDNWASISFDDFPSRTIPIQSWVDQTHVFSICANFPGDHLMESVTWIVEFHPILYRILNIFIMKSTEWISVIQYCIMSAPVTRI